MTEVLDQRLNRDDPGSTTVQAKVHWMPYRLFPYERRLGLRELERMGVTTVATDDGDVSITGDPSLVLERGTYFDHVVVEGRDPEVTQQSLVEAAHNQGRASGGARQATRYGLHGIHEYKGKFNPQVVRSLCNVVDLEAEVLIDPFCGSGTALLEGLRLGLDVVGVDRSPIAWYLATAKLEAAASPDKAKLAEQVLELGSRAGLALDRGQSDASEADLVPLLGQAAVDYLRHWFPAAAFAGLSHALELLYAEPDSAARKLSLVALSSVLREVSLQLPEDLRIRRRPGPFEAPRIAPLLVDALTVIRRGLGEMADWEEIAGTAVVVHGSADDPAALAPTAGGRRRLIVTSPPYATALPYIDTDRLSILALGLAEPGSLMPLERDLLGSREWVRAEQTRWDDRRACNADRLPEPITRLLAHVDRKNSEGGAGFRRRALPSLLYRYFAGMADAMCAWAQALSAGECAVLIVGHNRTTAGDEPIDIATPELLAHVAESRAFDVVELISLETWPRYGMHSANGVAGEDALVIRKRA